MEEEKSEILCHWIDDETENIMGSMFNEDEREYTHDYLEWKWKGVNRKHYDLDYLTQNHMIRLCVVMILKPLVEDPVDVGFNKFLYKSKILDLSNESLVLK